MWFYENVKYVELKMSEETNFPEFDETRHLVLRENSGHIPLCFCSVVKNSRHASKNGWKKGGKYSATKTSVG